MLLLNPIYGTTDDYILNSWLNGSTTGKSENESIFITSIFSQTVSFLYTNLTAIQWYSIILLTTNILSLSLIRTTARRQFQNKSNYLLVIDLFLITYLSWVILGITYTSTSIIAATSVMIYLIFEEKYEKRYLLLATLLLSLSFTIRPESLLGSLLIIYPLFLYRNKKIIKKFSIFAFFSLTVFVLFLLNNYSENRQSSEMRDYKEWAKKVQSFAGRPRMVEAGKNIGTSGWTASEYNLFVDLSYFDSKVFTEEWIDSGIEATENSFLQPNLKVENLFNIVKKWVQTTSPYNAYLFLILVFLISQNKWKKKYFNLLLIGNFIALHIFLGLFYQNVSRVSIPLLFSFLLGLVFFNHEVIVKRQFLFIASIIIIVLGFFQLNNANNLNKKRIESRDQQRTFIESQLQGRNLIIHGNQEFAQFTNPYTFNGSDTDPQLLMVGNWDTFSPQWYTRIKNMGITQLPENLLDNPSLVWSGPAIPNTTINLVNLMQENGYGEIELKKLGILPNGNDLWSFTTFKEK